MPAAALASAMLTRGGAPLQLAQILAAGDDFLARIAALLEVDPAQQFKIDHLRNELLLRGLGDDRHPGVNLGQMPGVVAAHAQLVGQRGRDGLRGVHRHLPLIARRAKDIGHADQRTQRMIELGERFGGQAVEPGLQRRFGQAAADAQHDLVARQRAGVAELGLGAQHEHRQALLDGRLDVARQLQEDRRGAAPHQERRQQTAFRRAVAGQAHLVQAQVLNVVGQLVVQEAGRFLAVERNQAKVGDRRDKTHRELRGGQLAGLLR
jgi:hypothetical protein